MPHTRTRSLAATCIAQFSMPGGQKGYVQHALASFSEVARSLQPSFCHLHMRIPENKGVVVAQVPSAEVFQTVSEYTFAKLPPLARTVVPTGPAIVSVKLQISTV